MRIGAAFPQNELAGDPTALRRFAVGVEERGYDHLVMFDHVVGAARVQRDHPMPARSYDDRDPFHDPLVAFSHVAAVTSRIELVTGILILPQRQTVLLARQAADVDLLSGGRLRLGVGIGYNPVEYQALGADWRTRGRRLDEQIPYLRRLWSGSAVSFTGEFDRIEQAAVNPVPARPIPIWCGGFSEAAYRRAARHADGFVFGYGFGDAALDSWRRIRDLLADSGRADDDFRSLFILLAEEEGAWADRTVAALPRLRDAGVTDVTVVSGRNGLTTLEEHLGFLDTVAAGAARVLG